MGQEPGHQVLVGEYLTEKQIKKGHILANIGDHWATNCSTVATQAVADVRLVRYDLCAKKWGVKVAGGNYLIENEEILVNIDAHLVADG